MYDCKLKNEIYKRGYTITGFAEEIGISRHTLIDIFKKTYKTTRGDTIYLIAKGLNVSFEQAKKIIKG